MARRRTTTEINAIHEDDLADLLDGLGVGQQYGDGSLRCAFCQRALKESGVGAVRMREEGVVVACARLDCVGEIA
jgi:hypothetical protein